MDKPTGVIYEYFYKGVQKLPVEAQAEAYNAYCELAFYGKEYEGDNLAIQVLMAAITDKVIADRDKFEEKTESRRTAGKHGGQASASKRKQKQANEANASKTNHVNVDVNVNDSDVFTDVNTESSNDDSKEKGDTIVSPKKKPSKPSLDEVKAYAAEQGKPDEAEHFFDYYTANGWKVGKNPMKDWKAAFRNWKRSAYNKSPTIDKDAEWEAFLARKAAEDD